ncbi:Exonuclease VII, small subunit [Syntrophomonas zehnderi OL-4]|uniref:Exodeoxyribonuclease 7 small subunit n=1 Tax=Syntrophomonas zehnderi OL-4 TaxID=690567 RepID=A0A0E4GBL5_9FIRM|nr:exodeoxyribonuclease VII small subunit [Syntrophomonas zehnderi]CFX49776.1 Exonuclease VII, small subunit [Syntrophomonas zehnderi OL-4]
MKKMNFDQSLKRLEEIVEELESGSISLEKSLSLFEEGVKLALYCQDELQKTDGKVSLLIRKMNGDLEVTDFNI